jgi:hypothetical protein
VSRACRGRLRCDGCWRACSYARFRGRVPVPGGPRDGRRPLPPWPLFADEGRAQQLRLTEAIAEGRGKGATRRTILGALRRAKLDAWERALAACPRRGEALPRTTEEALELAFALPAVEFRQRFLGWTPARARARRQALSLAEFATWWRKAGAQPELPFRPPDPDLDPDESPWKYLLDREEGLA